MFDILVASAILGNLILCWLLVWRGWVGRLPWFTLMTGAAVLVDVSFSYIHGVAHGLYAPLRIFIIYWLFPLWEIVCAWEAWRVGLKWLEYLMLIQVGLAVVACAAHLHGDIWTVYYLECFNVMFNLLGIWYCCFRFSQEPRYDPA